MAGRDQGGRVAASAVRELRMRHGLSVVQAAGLARVEPWAWAYWEERGMPRHRIGAFEIAALKTGDAVAVDVVKGIVR